MNDEIQKILDSAYIQMLQALLKTHSGVEGTCVLRDHILALSQQFLSCEQQQCVVAILDVYIVCQNLNGMRKQEEARAPRPPLFDVTTWTDRALSERYVEESRLLKKINRWTMAGKKNGGSARTRGISPEEAYGPRPCSYPNTAMMNACKRELVRRGLPVPEVSLPE